MRVHPPSVTEGPRALLDPGWPLRGGPEPAQAPDNGAAERTLDYVTRTGVLSCCNDQISAPECCRDCEEDLETLDTGETERGPGDRKGRERRNDGKVGRKCVKRNGTRRRPENPRKELLDGCGAVGTGPGAPGDVVTPQISGRGCVILGRSVAFLEYVRFRAPLKSWGISNDEEGIKLSGSDLVRAGKLISCMDGIRNTNHLVVCPDWPGRGRTGVGGKEKEGGVNESKYTELADRDRGHRKVTNMESEKEIYNNNVVTGHEEAAELGPGLGDGVRECMVEGHKHDCNCESDKTEEEIGRPDRSEEYPDRIMNQERGPLDGGCGEKEKDQMLNQSPSRVFRPVPRPPVVSSSGTGSETHGPMVETSDEDGDADENERVPHGVGKKGEEAPRFEVSGITPLIPGLGMQRKEKECKYVTSVWQRQHHEKKHFRPPIPTGEGVEEDVAMLNEFGGLDRLVVRRSQVTECKV